MKRIISILMTVAITLSMTVPVMANVDITVIADDKKIEFDAQPEMVNERTMVPMRAIFEELGAIVSWDQTTQTVTAVTATKTVVATIGKTVMTVNGEEKVMDVAPYVKDDRTYVPARFVAEALDCTVDWEQSTHTVNISSGVSENYLYAYNAIKDFVMTNGHNDENFWLYLEHVDDVDVYVIYDGTKVELALNTIIEGWNVLYEIMASRGGKSQVNTKVVTDVGVSELIIGFGDGEWEVLTEDFDPVSESAMYDMSNAWVDIANQVFRIIDEECTVSELGITKVTKD